MNTAKSILFVGFLFVLFLSSAQAADTLYKCGATYQSHPCDEGQQGKKLSDLPEVSKLSASGFEANVGQNEAPSQDAEVGGIEQPRARLPHPDEQVGAKRSPESKLLALESSARRLKHNSLNFRPLEGRSLFDEANRLISESKVVCIPSLFEKGVSYKNRCQEVKRMLAQVTVATKNLK